MIRYAMLAGATLVVGLALSGGDAHADCPNYNWTKMVPCGSAPVSVPSIPSGGGGTLGAALGVAGAAVGVLGAAASLLGDVADSLPDVPAPSYTPAPSYAPTPSYAPAPQPTATLSKLNGEELPLFRNEQIDPNVIKYLARLKARDRDAIVGAIGDDEARDYVIEALRRRGITVAVSRESLRDRLARNMPGGPAQPAEPAPEPQPAAATAESFRGSGNCSDITGTGGPSLPCRRGAGGTATARSLMASARTGERRGKPQDRAAALEQYRQAAALYEAAGDARRQQQAMKAADRLAALMGDAGQVAAAAGQASPFTGYGASWKARCESLEQQGQIEASSCWGGLAGSVEAANQPGLADYANERISYLAANGPQGDDAQRVRPIAPGCTADYPIRRTGPICKAVPGNMSVGETTACCVAIGFGRDPDYLRKELRKRLAAKQASAR